MIKVGITGQPGFVGTHLYILLGITEVFVCVYFDYSFFDCDEKMESFVSQSDAIVHLAAMTRHPDPQVIYNTNVELVDKLIRAMEKTNSTPHNRSDTTTPTPRNPPAEHCAPTV